MNGFNTPYPFRPRRDHHQWQEIAYYMVQQVKVKI
jgi:hypothetical protein